MFKLPNLILVFSITFTIFLIAPAFIGVNFSPYPIMKSGDAFDLLTPAVLLPLYWLLFIKCCETIPNLRESLVFVMLAGLWAMGHGMHLAANSIGHLLDQNTVAYELTYFYDEVLSHYLWHLGVVCLVGLLLSRSWRHVTEVGDGISWQVTLAGLLHGLTLSIMFVEGGTVLLGLPFITALVLGIIIWGRLLLKSQPVVTFFFISGLVALITMGVWAIYWGEWPIPQICDRLGIC